MSETHQLFVLRQQADYEISDSGRLTTLPEGSGGEIAPGPVNISFGETNRTKWPDSFIASSVLMGFREDLAKQLELKYIKGAEWYPANIISIRNRRLLQVPAPKYSWCRIIGRIRTTPYYVRYVPTEERYADGQIISKPIQTDEPVELDKFGCLVVNELEKRWLRHQLKFETWDGSDMARVLPTGIAPYQVFSSRFAQLLKELSVQNIKAFPLQEGYGL